MMTGPNGWMVLGVVDGVGLWLNPAGDSWEIRVGTALWEIRSLPHPSPLAAITHARTYFAEGERAERVRRAVDRLCCG